VGKREKWESKKKGQRGNGTSAITIGGPQGKHRAIKGFRKQGFKGAWVQGFKWRKAKISRQPLAFCRSILFSPAFS